VKPGFKVKSIILLLLLIATGVMPWYFTVDRGNGARNSVDLGALPREFGAWRMVSQHLGASSFEKGFLNDVLFRVYERTTDGRSVVLAVAYGADQRQNFSIHVPEGCYRAAGYDVTTVGLTRLSLPDLPMKQLCALKDKTSESIQYWIVLNGQVVTDHFERKLKQLYYSLLGARAGGVLVRVSSISSLNGGTLDFEVQKEFVSSLYGALKGEQRKLLFGEIVRSEK
jgi:EpsI family protein